MLKKILPIIIFAGLALWATMHHDAVLTQSRQVLSWVSTLKQVKEVQQSINITDIIEATNKERIAEGLLPFSTNEQLNNSAEMKVDDMIDRQYFEHQSPTGEGVSDLGKKAGYEYVIMGENLALGAFTSSADIVKAWMESPGHKANILNTKYEDIGVSVKSAVYEGKEVWFAVQHFGTSRGACPLIDTSLKYEIESLNRELKIEEQGIAALKQRLEAPGAPSDPSYKENIAVFNNSVDAYNRKLAVSRQKVEIYNSAVRDFNKCIATF
ncbi:MAG: CAP domain-containing protein [Patescibacteria group bacterium]